MTENKSLGEAFRTAQQQFNKHARGANDVQDQIDEFCHLASKIDRARVFSSNESLQDITTKDLPLVNVGFYLGRLYEEVKTGDRHERMQIVTKIEYWYTRFIDTCKDYEGLVPEILKSKRRDDDDEEEEEEKGHRAHKDAARTREEKIAMYKYEKQLGGEIEGSSFQAVDEDGLRQLYIKQIQLHVMKAVQSLESVRLEKEMLRMRGSGGGDNGQEDYRNKGRSTSKDNDDRVEQPLLSKTVKTNFLGQGLAINKVNRPFTLVGSNNSKREQLRNQVFQSDYRLPTMSVEEYLENLEAQGGIIKGGGGGQELQEPQDSDTEEAHDRETYKQREWDEFTDANPKGSGNQMMNRG